MQRLRTTAAELIRHRRALSGASGRRQAADTILVKPDYANSNSHISRVIKDKTQAEGTACLAKGQFRWYMMGSTPTNQFSKYTRKHCVTPYLVRTAVSNYSTQASQRTAKEETRKDVSTVEEPFDPLTDIIPEKPVTFVEGASYSFIILAGLGVAAFAAYAVFKELVIQPKEYKVFNKALQRIQDDSQVKVRIGSPITGYGSESRNRHARQRIPHHVWKDQKGVEHIKVNFYIRGPHGAGMVDAVMFKDPKKSWQFQYLVVDISSPSRTQLMLESYIPE